MAQKLNLVELAIRGVGSEVLAKNIASMNPSMIIASRILNGVEMPTLEQTDDYLQKVCKGSEIISVTLGNAFEESCLQINYRYPRTVFWKNEYIQPEGVAVVDREEYKKMDNISYCRDRESDEYKYKMIYWETSWEHTSPENVCC